MQNHTVAQQCCFPAIDGSLQLDSDPGFEIGRACEAIVPPAVDVDITDRCIERPGQVADFRPCVRGRVVVTDIATKYGTTQG